jgi:hypothetical protein
MQQPQTATTPTALPDLSLQDPYYSGNLYDMYGSTPYYSTPGTTIDLPGEATTPYTMGNRTDLSFGVL